jgi:DNA-binding LacI/PurR family transcriptional regulator
MTKRKKNAPEHTVSIKDVAAYAGVSISTVSNVLNGTKTVSGELCRRVLDAVDELHYQANTLAKGLKSGKTNMLCVIVPSIVSVFFPKVLRGMQTAAAAHGYSLTIYETGEDFEKERNVIHMLRLQRADGILLSTCCGTHDNAAYIEELKQLSIGGKRIPVVFFEEAPQDGLDAVVVDNKTASRAAAAYLLELGRRDIAYIAAPMHRFMMGKKRYEGYLAALREAGVAADERLVREGDYTPVSGYSEMRALLSTGCRIDGVLCGNDQMAIGAIRALHEAGIRVPDDVAVIGFDNNFPGTLISPSLSTVSVPKQRMGQEAVELLLWRIGTGEGAPPRTIELETNLVVRRSTDPNGESDWDLFDW